jgi:hypothetical protein
MSTYAVFGMTKHRAIEEASKKIETHDKKTGDPIPESEWTAKVEQMAAETMASSRVIQLSERFDAPQFAREFLTIAQKYESRSLHIKAYAKTGEKNPKTGKPIMQWSEVH